MLETSLPVIKTNIYQCMTVVTLSSRKKFKQHADLTWLLSRFLAVQFPTYQYVSLSRYIYAETSIHSDSPAGFMNISLSDPMLPKTTVLFSFWQTSMLGMKRDCGGAAGILGAFRAAVKQVSLKSVTSSKLPFLLCNSSFQVKCLLVAMWRWEHSAFVGLNSMTVIVFYVKSTRGWLHMHSPKHKNKTRQDNSIIVLLYWHIS